MVKITGKDATLFNFFIKRDSTVMRVYEMQVPKI